MNMPEGKYFFIRNQLSGLVVDIENRKCEAGHEIVLSEKRDEGNDTQIWYEEQFTGTIRSKLFDLCLTISGTCDVTLGSNVRELGIFSYEVGIFQKGTS